MPKRSDIEKILIIGSGPIIIGQACEFDYSGAQACKALKQDGFKVVLINSNPATIMTDPEMADRTYIEPITVEVLEKIIERERPDACLPTMGGQTGLNVAMQAAEKGIFKKYGVELIGAKYEAIRKAENRAEFKKAMERIGLDLPRSAFAYNVTEALKNASEIGYPVIVRPSFTLGGFGSGVCYNREELEKIVTLGLEYSMNHEVLIEESVLGWKEFELEVMRDIKDNVVIICSIENFDPMGVHTGDSITVAPAQTLTDKEYQRMRDASVKCIREIGVETGGSNIQFAVNPQTGRMVVIEMNPRVSRSSALASKATGFPIAKMAARLAVGYTLDEIPNDITQVTPACFEPTIDYCVVKIPRFAFEKFPGVDDTLTSQMKSVGEVMAIGRTFKEALQKGLRSLETKRFGLGGDGKDEILGEKIRTVDEYISWLKRSREDHSICGKLLLSMVKPKENRVFSIKYAFQAGASVNDIHEATGIDPWFLYQIREIVDFEMILFENRDRPFDRDLMRRAKRMGFSDRQLAFYQGKEEGEIRKRRKKLGVLPTYKLVDTCAAEFKAYTPYFYSTYEQEDETVKTQKPKVMILGGGPNRIGQGIEFDYCCVQAAFALKELGFETIMVNSNPETVSTDYDTSDKLFFEPLTFEDVMNIHEKEKPVGVIVQLGGQTPLNLSRSLEQAGVKILGTSSRSINKAEDRDEFRKLLAKVKLAQPANGMASTEKEAIKVAKTLGYPVLVRPSYVLGGRAMEIAYDETQLKEFMRAAVEVSDNSPVLIDKFLEHAAEVDVDLIADGKHQVVGAVLEHIEEAGIHSGDSAMAIPPFTLSPELIAEIMTKTKRLAQELRVKGLMNVQYALSGGKVYCLEVNPRASRTVPFVSKAIGVPLARLAAKVMGGKSLEELGFIREVAPPFTAVKESVLPFIKFPGVDIILSPEMKSTGEVMGIDQHFGLAYFKSQDAAYSRLPLEGTVFISVKEGDKKDIVSIAHELAELGYKLIATRGTHDCLVPHQIPVEKVLKLEEGRPNIRDRIMNREVHLIINTPSGKGPTLDEAKIRSLAVSYGIPCITTIDAARAALAAICAFKDGGYQVKSLQEYHGMEVRKTKTAKAGEKAAK